MWICSKRLLYLSIYKTKKRKRWFFSILTWFSMRIFHESGEWVCKWTQVQKNNLKTAFSNYFDKRCFLQEYYEISKFRFTSNNSYSNVRKRMSSLQLLIELCFMTKVLSCELRWIWDRIFSFVLPRWIRATIVYRVFQMNALECTLFINNGAIFSARMHAHYLNNIKLF